MKHFFAKTKRKGYERGFFAVWLTKKLKVKTIKDHQRERRTKYLRTFRVRIPHLFGDIIHYFIIIIIPFHFISFLCVNENGFDMRRGDKVIQNLKGKKNWIPT